MVSSNLEKRALLIVYMVMIYSSILFDVSDGAFHKVGDSAGWTTIGNLDYNHWAVTKTFHLGDIIAFEYNPQFHNVMRVTHADYKACNASSPISTHTSGNDSITIDNYGHHFFLCGVPGHCQAGQKVDINVIRRRDPSVAPPSSSPVPAVTAVPALSPSDAVSICDFSYKFFLLVLQLVYMCGLY